MIKKLFKKSILFPRVLVTMLIIGFVILAGTAGALDIDSIAISQAIQQSIIGLGLIGISVLLLRDGGFEDEQ